MKSGATIRLSITISVAWFFGSVTPLPAEMHPHAPIRTLPQVTTTSPQNTSIQQVSTADISAGIKRHIAAERRSSNDKKFHLKYQGKNLALDLVRVHDDRLSSL